LPNIIKAYTVIYDDKIKKTIDSQKRQEKKKPKKKAAGTETRKTGNAFVEGLDALMVEELPSEEETKKANYIIENAKKEAQCIFKQAKEEAEKIKKDAYAAANLQGYEDGKKLCDQEAEKQKAEYADKMQQLEKEYNSMTAKLEPKIADIIASLVKKITGIIVEGKEEVILYLVEKALKKYDKSNEYTLRIAPENYKYIMSKKEFLQNFIEREVKLHVTEDPSLHINQCMIETDLRVINCSLDEQLYNLITDLKLIGHTDQTEGG
jgi:flagellar assembly protein FliH